MYDDTDRRYLHDADFRAAVDTLRHMAEVHGFTPGELRQIAFKAAFELEMRRPPAPMRLDGVDFVPAPQTTAPEMCSFCGLVANSAGCQRSHP